VSVGLGSPLESTHSYNRLATTPLFQLQKIKKLQNKKDNKIYPTPNKHVD